MDTVIAVNKQQKLIINDLLAALKEERESNQLLQQKVFRYKKQTEESESLLQACTVQNINTVLNLSKQNDDLM